MSFEDPCDAQHRDNDLEKYEVTVKLVVWASGETASERVVEKIIQGGKITLLEEEEDLLDDYDIEDTSPAAL
jgi:hypothetical protein